MLNTMAKSFIFILFFVILPSSWSQTNMLLLGTIVNEKKDPIGFVKIDLLDSLGNLVTSANSSEDDGNFQLSFHSTSSYFQLEIKADCFVEQSISIPNDGDFTPLYVVLESHECTPKKSSDCPNFSESCSVIPVKHYSFIFRPTHQQWRDNKKGKLKLLPYSGCCEKQWFCTTHQLAY